MVLVAPVIWLGFMLQSIVLIFIGFVMFMVAQTVQSTVVRRSVLIGIDAIFFSLFVAVWIDLKAEPGRQELIRLENVAQSNLQNFSAEVSIAWGDEGFEAGHMMADRRLFYAGLLGGPRDRHLPSGDLPSFAIYDTQIDNVNLSNLPDPGIPFAMEISGGGVRKLPLTALEPLLIRFKTNLKWLRLSGGLDDTVLYWLITQEGLDVSVDGHENRMNHIRQRYGIRQ